MWPYSSSFDFGEVGEPEIGNGVMPHRPAGERRFWLAGGFPDVRPRGRPATPLLRLHVIPIDVRGGAFDPPGRNPFGEIGGPGAFGELARPGAPWLLGQTLASLLDRELAGAIRDGAIFFDSGGRLFERRGPTLIPVTEPRLGTHRRVIDLEPDEVRVTDPEGRDRRATTERASGAGVRALLPDPGQWRVIRWSDFRKPLASQLARPERLSDNHRLPCFVQVFEATAPQSREMLARQVLGETGSAAELPRLTHAAAVRLGLLSLHRGRPNARRAPGEPDTVALPGDRFVHLRLAFDPTADSGGDERAPEAPPAAPPAARGPRARASGPVRRPAPGAPEAPAEREPGARPQPRRAEPERDPVGPLDTDLFEAPSVAADIGPAWAAPGHPGAGRREIPGRFLAPWELRRSREEALYDLQRAGASRNPLIRLARWVRRQPGRRERLRKWQMMLAGKSYDDQLWLVRPPRHGLDDPLVLDWAERCLALAGYDPLVMLDEWEIYWRRKGL